MIVPRVEGASFACINAHEDREYLRIAKPGDGRVRDVELVGGRGRDSEITQLSRAESRLSRHRSEVARRRRNSGSHVARLDGNAGAAASARGGVASLRIDKASGAFCNDVYSSRR